MTPDLLLFNLRDATLSNRIVMFLRFVTSAELQRREDFFAPFIMVRGMPHTCVECEGSVTNMTRGMPVAGPWKRQHE